MTKKLDLKGLAISVGVVIIAWLIAISFHIPFEIISLIGCIACALFIVFTS